MPQVDNVPLLVSLFTDATTQTTLEMIGVLQVGGWHSTTAWHARAALRVPHLVWRSPMGRVCGADRLVLLLRRLSCAQGRGAVALRRHAPHPLTLCRVSHSDASPSA
jgi:hypothetical protein